MTKRPTIAEQLQQKDKQIRELEDKLVSVTNELLNAKKTDKKRAEFLQKKTEIIKEKLEDIRQEYDEVEDERTSYLF